MRVLIAAAALLVSMSAAADPPYALTATFDMPNTGGPIDGCRVYVDDELVGEVTSGRSFGETQDAGRHTIGVECFNARGAGERVTVAIDIDDFEPAPGPVRNLRITVECDVDEPEPSCTVTAVE